MARLSKLSASSSPALSLALPIAIAMAGSVALESSASAQAASLLADSASSSNDDDDDEPALPDGLASQPESPEQPGDDDDGDDDEPGLPAGLDQADGDAAGEPGDEPGLPTGLDGDDDGDEPDPPIGLNGKTDDEPNDESDVPGFMEWLGLSGFLDARFGSRIPDDPGHDRIILGETRLQVAIEKPLFDSLLIQLSADFIFDPVGDIYTVDLEVGEGVVDLRQASITYSPLPFLDIKLGRQLLTWGTGDLVFLNDLFPKDFQAFFIGRDIEYLKAPSDAAKVSVYTQVANLDIVYVPRFDRDRGITGQRLSYFNPFQNDIVGGDDEDDILDIEAPDEWLDDYELHARLSRTIGSIELAAYGYYGFWKSPGGADFEEGLATFPPLSVYGASLRDQLLGGIINIEGAYLDSRDDRDGTDPAINNDEARYLLGYERQLPALANDLTVGAQYYLEQLLNYGNYQDSQPEGAPLRDRFRHVATLRLTKLLLQQNLTLSLYTQYSPSDQDIYIRPLVSYKIADCCSATLGGNLFFGKDDETFFNQLQYNTNAYLALRYSY